MSNAKKPQSNAKKPQSSVKKPQSSVKKPQSSVKKPQNGIKKLPAPAPALLYRGKALLTPPLGLRTADMIAIGCIMLACLFWLRDRNIFADTTLSFSLAYLDGHVFDFFRHNRTIFANYSIVPDHLQPLYLLIALWNAPFRLSGPIGQTAMGAPLPSPALVTWNSLLPVVFFVLCAVTLYKIARLIAQGQDPAKWSVFLFFSSPLAIYIIFMAPSNYDIFFLTFMMLGLHAFLQRRHWHFILWFALATAFEFHALLPFMALLLLDEKKLWKLLRGLLAAAAPALICVALTLPDPGCAAGERLQRLIRVFQAYPIKIGPMMTPLFVAVAYLTVCIFARAKHAGEDERERQKYAVLLPLAAMSIVFIYMSPDMKWVGLTAPWLALAFLFSPSGTFSLLFETAGTAAVFLRVLAASAKLCPPQAILPYIDAVTLLWLLSPFLLQLLEWKKVTWPAPGLFKTQAGYARLRCYGGLAFYLLPIILERAGTAWFPDAFQKLCRAVSGVG